MGDNVMDKIAGEFLRAEVTEPRTITVHFVNQDGYKDSIDLPGAWFYIEEARRFLSNERAKDPFFRHTRAEIGAQGDRLFIAYSHGENLSEYFAKRSTQKPTPKTKGKR